MSNVVQGKNSALMVNVLGVWYLIACQTDFSFEYANENILKTDVNAGSFRKRRPRISDISGSVSGVTTTTNTSTISIFYFLQEAIRRAVQSLKFVWTDNDGLTKEIATSMLIKTIDITGPQGDFSKFEMTLEGAGDGLTIDPVLPPDPGSDEGVDSDVWNTTPGGFTISGPGIDSRSFAGKTLFLVAREGAVYFPESPLTTTTGYGFDGTTITFINAFNPGERVTVAWHD